ncbi:spore coat U domain-containing protein [Nodularia spumigena CS-584]|jgi:spore coat protein U-like protein|uniref:Spore coat protein, late developmental n=3 Tax=Nodularia spumigena TaxID=70799 RepID=A0A166KLI9_NODSP|nr:MULTISPECIES: spore coat U domain-containing protein [Cyanophyceae]MDB9356359.1 spore coat U domain-containing protein [Nodularia spumigena CS-587/03]EAW45455.1 spore coat protein, late developmental, putative [Nodularia spumigena CCY9414]KZL51281.1 spore coat protein, late developmental [Nodularia spumigena CENA596]MDB9316169.1 spore coat U domain-containing protein [Nodularia spumigena CS-590/01A]MDB9320879.1 spore coat U domain-containing protein [Nodularia spumigena CS-591/07A]
MKLRPSLLTVLLLMASSTAPAMAGSANANLNVSASVVPSIVITPAAAPVPIPVENITNPSTPATATVPIAITLPSNTTGKITLGQGQNPSTGSTDTQPVRRMTDGAGNYLLYELYQDESRTIIWGNTDNTALSLTGTGSASNVNLYIKIPAGQNVPAGNYQDTVQLKAAL